MYSVPAVSQRCLLHDRVGVSGWCGCCACCCSLQADIRNAFNDAKPYLQILSNNRYFSHGAYYFALSMAQEKTVQPEEAAAGGDIFFVRSWDGVWCTNP